MPIGSRPSRSRRESGDLARAGPRHARLRAQVRLHRRGARPVGRHRLGADGRDRRRGARPRSRARRADALALLLAGAASTIRWRSPRNLGIRDADAADRAGDARHGRHARAGVRRHGRDVTEENIQARIRGNLLMALSNKLGALLLTTGNKSELAVGYCTLYGDMSGGLAVIADVPKTMVYRVARWLNERADAR